MFVAYVMIFRFTQYLVQNRHIVHKYIHKDNNNKYLLYEKTKGLQFPVNLLFFVQTLSDILPIIFVNYSPRQFVYV